MSNENYQNLKPSDWSKLREMYAVRNIPSDEIIPRRRPKRNVPEVQKDDKYWERRNRNNLAAKRSRDNKRRAEADVGIQILYLKQENALLKKEIMMLRLQAGLAPDKSILSREEKLKCLSQVKENEALNNNGVDVCHDSENSETGMSSVPISVGNIPPKPETSVSKHFQDFPFDSKHTSRTAFAHNALLYMPYGHISIESHSNPEVLSEKNADIEDFDRGEPVPYGSAAQPNVFPQVPFQHRMPYSYSQGFYSTKNQNSSFPEDLSFCKETKSTSQSKQRDGIRIHGQHHAEQTESESKNTMDKIENQDLKHKILQLSAQVEEMKEMVLK